MKGIKCSAVAFLLVSAVAAQAQTQVPHTFQSGQPALAVEVNANFDAIEAGIDANSNSLQTVQESVASITASVDANIGSISQNSAAIAEGDAALASRLGAVVLDGNGDEIGQLISIGENLWSLIAINQSGYIQSVSFQDGTVGSGALVYESTDCSGTPYAIDTFGGHVQRYFDALGNPSLYYVEKSAVTVSNFTLGSLSFESGCFAQFDAGRTVWPVSINDPAVTGVSSGTYSLPIRIERAE